MAKKLYKNPSDKKIAGVCSGFAEYFDIDVTIIRLAWLFFFFVCGSGLIAYILAMIVMPNKPNDTFIGNA